MTKRRAFGLHLWAGLAAVLGPGCATGDRLGVDGAEHSDGPSSADASSAGGGLATSGADANGAGAGADASSPSAGPNGSGGGSGGDGSGGDEPSSGSGSGGGGPDLPGGQSVWMKVFPGAVPSSVVRDDAGDYFITGTALEVDFGGGPIGDPNQNGAFVLKLDAQGNLVWSKVFGGGGIGARHVGQQIAVDAQGHVFVAGTTTGLLDLGGDPLADWGLFVAELDASGEHVWSRALGGQAVAGLAVDSDGAPVALIGDCFAFAGPCSSNDAMKTTVAKLTSTGTLAWMRSLEAPMPAAQWNDVWAGSLALDEVGGVLVAGRTNTTVTVDDGHSIPRAGEPIWQDFVLSLDESGSFAWGQSLGGGGNAPRVRATPGGFLVGGDFSDSMTLGEAPFLSAGQTDLFVAGFDAAGSELWSERYGDAETQWLNLLSVDATGAIAIAGQDFGAMDLGDDGQAPVAGASSVVFVAKMSGAGLPTWATRFATAVGQLNVTGLVGDVAGVVVTGHSEAPIDFGEGPVDTGGMYVLALAP